jgi:hypothetical protein
MKRISYIAVGLVAGILAATSVPALAAWLVSSSGEASIALASLQPVEVGRVTLDADAKALPGKKVALVASSLTNTNGVLVQVLETDLKALESDDPDCKASLGLGIKFLSRDTFDLPDGKTENVTLGSASIGQISNRCQGAVLTGTVLLRVGYGS